MTYDDGETPIPQDEAKRIADEIVKRPPPKKDAVPLEDELPYADDTDDDGNPVVEVEEGEELE